eukprot:GHVO01053470.1.p1 GENE.GHVO01053470.1~~GHVO01053470.1.p1  ORF type:complete len:127 (+),score=12.55 GHVO01053470.1:133-513(+)
MGNTRSRAARNEVMGYHTVVQGCQWQRFVEKAWSTDRAVVIHTVQLPPGMSMNNPRLATAEIVHERHYRLPAGTIPYCTKHPATVFDVAVDDDVMQAFKIKVPQRFSVVDKEVHEADDPTEIEEVP